MLMATSKLWYACHHCCLSSTNMFQQKYIPSDGSLAEQFSRSNGSPLSAVDLTWSYAALLTAANARLGTMPASWNASSTVPTTCSSGSASGPCAVATNTAWPGRTPSPTPCSTSSNTYVHFNEQKVTNYGDSVFLTGNVSQLGNWNTNNALALNADDYTQSNPIWKVSTTLPIGSTIQYKYFVKSSSGSITWESDPNR